MCVYYLNSASSPACVTIMSKLSSSFFRIHQVCCTLAVLFEWKACAMKRVMCTYHTSLSCYICKEELVCWPGLWVRVVRTKAGLSSAFALCVFAMPVAFHIIPTLPCCATGELKISHELRSQFGLVFWDSEGLAAFNPPVVVAWMLGLQILTTCL